MSACRISRVILFAEDNADDLALFERVTLGFGPEFHLRTVRDGQEAIRYLRGDAPYGDRHTHPFPHLVVLDIMLPSVTGLDVLAWIRQQSAWRGLVVLILTGSDSEEHVRQAYELHVNSFLRKNPLLFAPVILKSVLEYWLKLNQLPNS